ncbi:MAG: hypothetical protein IKF64_06690 [Eubacterium sp.]|nr:hypothetical protein [Eubacterium sp.]
MTQKQKKNAIVMGAVLGVLLVIGIVFSLLMRVNQPLYTKVSIALMPETIEYTNPDTKETIVFYVEENKEYNAEKDEPINAYKTYYYKDDAKKEKVYLENGVYMTDKEFAESKRADLQNQENKADENGAKYNVGVGQQVTIGFLMSAQENANKVKTVVNVFLALFIIACVGYLIYLWYLNWSIRQDKKEKKLAEAEAKLSEKKSDEDE